MAPQRVAKIVHQFVSILATTSLIIILSLNRSHKLAWAQRIKHMKNWVSVLLPNAQPQKRANVPKSECAKSDFSISVKAYRGKLMGLLR